MPLPAMIRTATATAALAWRQPAAAAATLTAAGRLYHSSKSTPAPHDDPYITVHHDTLPSGARTGVVTLSLNRPSTLNALTAPMGDAFTATLADLARDPNLRALILTGTGRAFSAGGDLDFLRNRMHASNLETQRPCVHSMRGFLRFARCPCPQLQRLMAQPDMRLTVDDAKVGFNFVKLGITPGMGAQTTVEALVGTQVAARLLLTGDLISGSEAQRLGLVLASHKSAADLDDAALKLARSVASASPVAVRMTTKEADTQALCYTSPDFKEGISAISAKRAPVFPLSKTKTE
ncbi:ClpP/crotonase-like domain-containing protein [Catenaria anguillulae PL171]|uniref:ClpP/crotonase-like domain-containing protein n=1 Tax=Catenaria anguillulae PL171 TaxID=765915 RepID=A0A1Y2I3K8_9FUNG|nr:ClpP/crotonase-like domain-containing protein [Catenaria anguillulae PL171]